MSDTLRECPSYPGWRVSECGTLAEYRCRQRGWTSRRIFQAKKTRTQRGYCYCQGCCGESIRPVHQLVADAWIRPRTGDRQEYVLHRDDNPAHNTASNLYYGDAVKNYEDALTNGGCIPKTWTREQLAGFQDRCRAGERLSDIGLSVGVTGPYLSTLFKKHGLPTLPRGSAAPSRQRDRSNPHIGLKSLASVRY